MRKSLTNSPRQQQSTPNSGIRTENKCQECGCACNGCVDIDSIHLHQEIEDLKSRLGEREKQLVSMESQIISHAKQYPNGEMQALRESLSLWQNRYDRMLENYRKLQKVNQGLEDKLLRIADKFEAEKMTLSDMVSDLSAKLTFAETSIVGLQQESKRYRNDCNLAISLLQCKPSQFVAHKLDSLPNDIQTLANQHLNYPRTANYDTTDLSPNSVKSNGKQISVPFPTFPPTAMAYSLSNQNVDTSAFSKSTDNASSITDNYVSAAVMAKILEERGKERLDQDCDGVCSLQPQSSTLASIPPLSPRSSTRQTTTTTTTGTTITNYFQHNDNGYHSQQLLIQVDKPNIDGFYGEMQYREEAMIGDNRNHNSQNPQLQTFRMSKSPATGHRNGSPVLRNAPTANSPSLTSPNRNDTIII